MRTRIILICVCIAGTVLTSCSSSKNATASPAVSPLKGEVAVEDIPFADFRSDEKYYRAVGEALSPDMTVAKRMAILNAKSLIASSIQATFDEVTTQYVKQYSAGQGNDLVKKFESMNQTVVSQVLSNVTVRDEKVFRVRKTGEFRYYVAVEMSKQSLSEAAGITGQSKKQIDLDEAEYRKIFDQVLREAK